jgi:hypothetical protein
MLSLALGWAALRFAIASCTPASAQPTNGTKNEAGQTMRLIHLFQSIWQRLRGRILLIDFKIKQRRSLKKQKADDPNIYPLW